MPSSVFDNPAPCSGTAQTYVRNLASMPEAERNALLYGDWDTFSGQVFTEWRNDPGTTWTRGGHVIRPFRVPDTWRIWRSFDWGYARRTSWAGTR